MSRVRAAAVLSLSVALFAIPILSFAAESAGDQAANSECPKPDATHKYDASKGKTWTEKDGNTAVTITNLYGKFCEENQVSVHVKGTCVAVSKCKATQYCDASGKNCKSVGDIEKIVNDTAKEGNASSPTNQEIAHKVNTAGQTNSALNDINKSFEQGSTPVETPQTSGWQFNNQIANLTGQDFSQWFGNDISQGESLLGQEFNAWNQQSFSPASLSQGAPDLGGSAVNAGGYDGGAAFNGAQTTGFGEGGGVPVATNDAQFGGVPTHGATLGSVEAGSPSTFAAALESSARDPWVEDWNKVPAAPQALSSETGGLQNPLGSSEPGEHRLDNPLNHWTGANQSSSANYIPPGAAIAAQGFGSENGLITNPLAQAQAFGTENGNNTPPTSLDGAPAGQFADNIGPAAPDPAYLNRGGWVNGTESGLAGASVEQSSYGAVTHDYYALGQNYCTDIGCTVAIDKEGAFAFAGRAPWNPDAWNNPNPTNFATNLPPQPESAQVGESPSAQATGFAQDGTASLSDETRSATVQEPPQTPCETTGCVLARASEVRDPTSQPADTKPSANKDLNVTAYFPNSDPNCMAKGTCQMEGGPNTKWEGPDGSKMVHTLDCYAAGKCDYVTGASDKSNKDKTYEIPEITWRGADGKLHTAADVPVVVHDTGSRFQDRPDKLDIAVSTSRSDEQAVRLANGQPFLGASYQTGNQTPASVPSANENGPALSLRDSAPQTSLADLSARPGGGYASEWLPTAEWRPAFATAQSDAGLSGGLATASDVFSQNLPTSEWTPVYAGGGIGGEINAPLNSTPDLASLREYAAQNPGESPTEAIPQSENLGQVHLAADEAQRFSIDGRGYAGLSADESQRTNFDSHTYAGVSTDEWQRTVLHDTTGVSADESQRTNFDSKSYAGVTADETNRNVFATPPTPVSKDKIAEIVAYANANQAETPSLAGQSTNLGEVNLTADEQQRANIDGSARPAIAPEVPAVPAQTVADLKANPGPSDSPTESIPTSQEINKYANETPLEANYPDAARPNPYKNETPIEANYPDNKVWTYSVPTKYTYDPVAGTYSADDSSRKTVVLDGTQEEVKAQLAAYDHVLQTQAKNDAIIAGAQQRLDDVRSGVEGTSPGEIPKIQQDIAYRQQQNREISESTQKFLAGDTGVQAQLKDAGQKLANENTATQILRGAAQDTTDWSETKSLWKKGEYVNAAFSAFGNGVSTLVSGLSGSTAHTIGGDPYLEAFCKTCEANERAGATAETLVNLVPVADGAWALGKAGVRGIADAGFAGLTSDSRIAVQGLGESVAPRLVTEGAGSVDVVAADLRTTGSGLNSDANASVRSGSSNSNASNAVPAEGSLTDLAAQQSQRTVDEANRLASQGEPKALAQQVAQTGTEGSQASPYIQRQIENGAKVNPDGTITTADGRTIVQIDKPVIREPAPEPAPYGEPASANDNVKTAPKKETITQVEPQPETQPATAPKSEPKLADSEPKPVQQGPGKTIEQGSSEVRPPASDVPPTDVNVPAPSIETPSPTIVERVSKPLADARDVVVAQVKDTWNGMTNWADNSWTSFKNSIGFEPSAPPTRVGSPNEPPLVAGERPLGTQQAPTPNVNQVPAGGRAPDVSVNTPKVAEAPAVQSPTPTQPTGGVSPAVDKELKQLAQLAQQQKDLAQQQAIQKQIAPGSNPPTGAPAPQAAPQAGPTPVTTPAQKTTLQKIEQQITDFFNGRSSTGELPTNETFTQPANQAKGLNSASDQTYVSTQTTNIPKPELIEVPKNADLTITVSSNVPKDADLVTVNLSDTNGVVRIEPFKDSATRDAFNATADTSGTVRQIQVARADLAQLKAAQGNVTVYTVEKPQFATTKTVGTPTSIETPAAPTQFERPTVTREPSAAANGNSQVWPGVPANAIPSPEAWPGVPVRALPESSAGTAGTVAGSASGAVEPSISRFSPANLTLLGVGGLSGGGLLYGLSRYNDSTVGSPAAPPTVETGGKDGGAAPPSHADVIYPADDIFGGDVSKNVKSPSEIPAGTKVNTVNYPPDDIFGGDTSKNVNSVSEIPATNAPPQGPCPDGSIMTSDGTCPKSGPVLKQDYYCMTSVFPVVTVPLKAGQYFPMGKCLNAAPGSAAPAPAIHTPGNPGPSALLSGLNGDGLGSIMKFLGGFLSGFFSPKPPQPQSGTQATASPQPTPTTPSTPATPTSVTPSSVVTLAANPLTVAAGQTVTLTWAAVGPTSCAVFDPKNVQIGSGNPNGSATATVNATSIFKVTCTGGSGSATAQVTVTIK